jgi:hypothetical protein
MMKERTLFLVSFRIMIIALLCMSVNWLLVSLPDWTVRMIGIVILVDLVVLTYSTVKLKQKDHI